MDRNAILSGLMGSYERYASVEGVVDTFSDRVASSLVSRPHVLAFITSLESNRLYDPSSLTLVNACCAGKAGVLYSCLDIRNLGIEKVLKYSGDPSDIVQRADIKREVAVFRLQGASAVFLIEDSKPVDLDQSWEILVFVEQGDSHSVKEARYDRMLEITDQIIDWATAVSPSAVNSNLYTITLTGATPTVEFDGYLSTNLSFNSSIKIK